MAEITKKVEKATKDAVEEVKEVVSDIASTAKKTLKPSTWKSAWGKASKDLTWTTLGAGAALIGLGFTYSTFKQPSLTAPFVKYVPGVPGGILPGAKGYAQGVLLNIGKPSTIATLALGLLMGIAGGVSRENSPKASKVLIAGGTFTIALLAWNVFAPSKFKAMGKSEVYGTETVIPLAGPTAGVYTPKTGMVNGTVVPANTSVGQKGVDQLKMTGYSLTQGSGYMNPGTWQFNAESPEVRMSQIYPERPEMALVGPAVQPGSQYWLETNEGDTQNLTGNLRFEGSQFRNDDNGRVFQWTAPYNIRDIGAAF